MHKQISFTSILSVINLYNSLAMLTFFRRETNKKKFDYFIRRKNIFY